jgi:hypothetical protein
VASEVPLQAMEKLYPYMWTGFGLNAVSGIMLFIPEASVKGISPVFYTKMTFIAVAVVLMVRIRTRVLRNPLIGREPIQTNAKIFAWAAMFCWLAAITAGRLLAYVGPGTDSTLG